MLLVNVWICLMIMISQQEPSLSWFSLHKPSFQAGAYNELYALHRTGTKCVISPSLQTERLRSLHEKVRKRGRKRDNKNVRVNSAAAVLKNPAEGEENSKRKTVIQNHRLRSDLFFLIIFRRTQRERSEVEIKILSMIMVKQRMKELLVRAFVASVVATSTPTYLCVRMLAEAPTTHVNARVCMFCYHDHEENILRGTQTSLQSLAYQPASKPWPM